MSSTPLRPIGTIAALPVELKREILRFCDPRTLSIASMASFAFLELASPILYHDVDLASSAALQRFFCPRDQHVVRSRLSPHLSHASLRSFTIHLSSDYLRADLSRDRIARPAGTVRVRRLAIQTPMPLSTFVWAMILSLFDPDTVLLSSDFDAPEPPPFYLVTEGHCWPHLQRLELGSRDILPLPQPWPVEDVPSAQVETSPPIGPVVVLDLVHQWSGIGEGICAGMWALMHQHIGTLLDRTVTRPVGGLTIKVPIGYADRRREQLFRIWDGKVGWAVVARWKKVVKVEDGEV